jgi:hypothetical protein
MFVFFFVYLFSILCILYFCILLCIISPFVYGCLFNIFVHVYRPLPPGGNQTAINKYTISYYMKRTHIGNQTSYRLSDTHALYLKSYIQISARTSVILTDVFSGFPLIAYEN